MSGMSTLSQEDISRLTPAERLALIGDLWDSLSDAETVVSPAQQAELERRLGNFERERAEAKPWDQFKAELARRVP